MIHTALVTTVWGFIKDKENASVNITTEKDETTIHIRDGKKTRTFCSKNTNTLNASLRGYLRSIA